MKNAKCKVKMKEWIVFFSAVLLSASSAFQQTAAAQVFEGNISLRSQGQVDSFPYSCGCGSISGNLFIEGADIGDLSPLAGLAAVGGDLWVLNNASLAGLGGLSGLAAVGGDVWIRFNPALADLDGLSGLSSVGGHLRIWNNAMLASIDGLSALAVVGGDFSVVDNNALTGIWGPLSLASVGGELRFSGNAVLAGLDGLSALATVGGDLLIQSNPALANLDGLSALVSVGRNLDILRNDALADVDGLAALAAVGRDLYIQFNAALSGCCGIYELINGLGGKEVAGVVIIWSNAAGCEHPLAVNGACMPSSATGAAAPGFGLHQNTPNPFSSEAVIRFELPEAGQAVFSVHDLRGRLLYERRGFYQEGLHEIRLDALDVARPGFSPGVLSYTLRTSKHSATRRMAVLK
jgi:hypothetical protein